MAFLEHKKSDQSILYVQPDQRLFRRNDDTFITQIAHSVQRASAIGEVVFKYVIENLRRGKAFQEAKTEGELGARSTHHQEKAGENAAGVR